MVIVKSEKGELPMDLCAYCDEPCGLFQPWHAKCHREAMYDEKRSFVLRKAGLMDNCDTTIEQINQAFDQFGHLWKASY